jgi:para-aminobenzoate synthetase/4-amino-4-deoxychorismate lyase
MKPLNDATISSLAAWLGREDDFVLLESARVSRENHQSLLFRNPSRYLVCRATDDPLAFLAEADRLREQGLFLAGWLAYEFAYLLEPCLRHFLTEKQGRLDEPLAVLGVFEQPLIYDHASGLFRNGTAWPAREGESSSFACSQLQATIRQQQYLRAIETIQEYIRAGDSYQVNFTLHLDFHFQGSIAALYLALRRNQSVSYSSWIRRNDRDVLSFSPELFFSAAADRVRVRPMKGTMARGKTLAEDQKQQQRLAADPKNQSENVMIVDLLRNDLGRLLHTTGGGRVQPRSLFDVEVYQSLLQMTSTIDAVASEKTPLTFSQLISALFPCGSVTGAPKIRTMEIIHELEKQPRGVYCGAVGYTSLEKSCFNVPIRTLEISGSHGRMGIGSGIIADSVPEMEWQESLLKGKFLTGIAPDFQLIETLLWQSVAGFFLLEYHLKRLADSAAYFHFSCDLEAVRCQLQEEMIQVVRDQAAAPVEQQRVRLLLYRDGRITVTAVPVPDQPETAGLPLVIFSREQVKSDDPYLYHKTTRRNLYDRERQAAVEQGWYEVLFTNQQGQVTEGTISNLFLRSADSDILLTPRLSCGLLPGTCRQWLLEQGRAEEQVLTVADVMNASEVYVANSVRRLVRVQPVTGDDNG